MAGIWVDLVLAVLIAAAIVRGWWVGGVLETLTLGGLWLGIVVGFLAAPLVSKAASGAARTALLLAWLVVAALAGALAGQVLGARLRQKVRRGRLAVGDKVLGAGVGALATTAALWLVGTLLAASAPVWLSRPLQQSSILSAMDTVMPDPPTLFARVESLFNQAGFPIVVVNLPPGLATSQPLPTSAEVLTAASAVRASMVKVTGEACGLFRSGSGFVAEHGVVVTNAHVVAGETSTTVSDGAGVYRGSVVFYDPQLDVAVLRVPGLDAPAVTMSSVPVASGTTAATVGFPQGGSLTAAPLPSTRGSRRSASTSTAPRSRAATSTSCMPRSSPATRAARSLPPRHRRAPRSETARSSASSSRARRATRRWATPSR